MLDKVLQLRRGGGDSDESDDDDDWGSGGDDSSDGDLAEFTESVKGGGGDSGGGDSGGDGGGDGASLQGADEMRRAMAAALSSKPIGPIGQPQQAAPTVSDQDMFNQIMNGGATPEPASPGKADTPSTPAPSTAPAPAANKLPAAALSDEDMFLKIMNGGDNEPAALQPAKPVKPTPANPAPAPAPAKAGKPRSTRPVPPRIQIPPEVKRAPISLDPTPPPKLKPVIEP